MNCEQYQLMIQEFLDNELQNQQEQILFQHLSVCQVCRQELNQQMKIQRETRLMLVKTPESADKRILTSVLASSPVTGTGQANQSRPRYLIYSLAAALAVIAIASWLQISALHNDVQAFKAEYGTAVERIKIQSEQLDLLMNNLPAVQVASSHKQL